MSKCEIEYTWIGVHVGRVRDAVCVTDPDDERPDCVANLRCFGVLEMLELLQAAARLYFVARNPSTLDKGDFKRCGFFPRQVVICHRRQIVTRARLFGVCASSCAIVTIAKSCLAAHSTSQRLLMLRIGEQLAIISEKKNRKNVILRILCFCCRVHHSYSESAFYNLRGALP